MGEGPAVEAGPRYSFKGLLSFPHASSVVQDDNSKIHQAHIEYFKERETPASHMDRPLEFRP